MRYLYLLLLYLLAVTSNYAQSISSQAGLRQLSKDFQYVFQDIGWKIHVPLSSGGLDFTKGITFFKVKDTIHWSDPAYETRYRLDSLIMSSGHIQDSIAYMLLGIYDQETDHQIVDIKRYQHVSTLGQAHFPNPGVCADFVGGMRKFMLSLANYLGASVDVSQQDSSFIKIYFSNMQSYSPLAVYAKSPSIKEAVHRYFLQNMSRHLPPVRFGRPIYSYHAFKVKKMSDGFVLEDIDYGELFFCYQDDQALYFIEPLQETTNFKNEISFIYDEKWTEEEFLLSPDVSAIKQKNNASRLIEALKAFRKERDLQAFSGIYRIHIEIR